MNLSPGLFICLMSFLSFSVISSLYAASESSGGGGRKKKERALHTIRGDSDSVDLGTGEFHVQNRDAALYPKLITTVRLVKERPSCPF